MMSYQVLFAPDYARNFGPQFFDGRYWYKVNLSPVATTPNWVVFDTRTETFFGGTLTTTSTNANDAGLLLNAFRRRFGASLQVVTTEAGKLYIDQVDIDVSAQTATLSNILNVSNTDIVNNQSVDSHVLGDTIVFTFFQSPHIVFIDPFTGSTQRKIDTGFGTYRPRVGLAASIKGDDFYILLGRHYAGDPFRLLRVYAGTVTTITGSTVGGDSPHTWCSTVYICRNRTLFTGTGFSVLNSQPPIRWFRPQDFTVVGTTSLTSIYTYARLMGYWPIGESDTHILAVAVLWDNVWNYESNRSLHLIRVDRSTLSFVDHVRLGSFDYRIQLMPGSFQICALPIFDRQKRILYFPFNRSFADNQNGIVKIDVSSYLQQYGVNEFNGMMYYVGEYRRPTSLYLTASVV